MVAGSNPAEGASFFEGLRQKLRQPKSKAAFLEGVAMATRKSKLLLCLHRSGQWDKKVRGKTYYFGSDKDSALQRWAEEKDRLLAGLPIARYSDSPTLQELGNVFIANCRNRVASGMLKAWYSFTCSSVAVTRSINAPASLQPEITRRQTQSRLGAQKSLRPLELCPRLLEHVKPQRSNCGRQPDTARSSDSNP